MGTPSTVHQVSEVLKAVFRPGMSRHKAKELKRSGQQIHSYGTLRTYRAYAIRFARWAKSEYGIRELRELTMEMGETYITQYLPQRHSPATTKTAIAAIRMLGRGIAALGWGDGHLLPETLSTQPRTRATRRRGGAWSKKEAEEIRAALGGRLALLVQLLQGLGLRLHELSRLRVRDLRAAYFTGRVGVKGKGGKRRELDVPADLLVVLADLIGTLPDDARVLTVNRRTLQRAVRRAAEGVRLAPHGRGPHGFRYRYAADQYLAERRNGKSAIDAEKAVSQRLGHERPRITRLYLGGAGGETDQRRPDHDGPE